MSHLVFLIFAFRISRSDLLSHKIKNRDTALFAVTTLLTGANLESGFYLFSVFLALYLLPSGLGFGDVKLAFPIGAHLAFESAQLLFSFFFLVAIFATIQCVALSFFEGRLIREIPLAPSIFIAAGLKIAAG
jgi:prepilin signal peptidase PulO-like enzyme (type II secretory pathway)